MPVFKVHYTGHTATGEEYKSWYPVEAPDLFTAEALAQDNREPDEAINAVKYWKES